MENQFDKTTVIVCVGGRGGGPSVFMPLLP